jgi:hypothetical protein
MVLDPRFFDRFGNLTVGGSKDQAIVPRDSE